MSSRTRRETPVAAVILAAGAGERFGRPKHELMLAGQSVVERALDVVRPRARDVILVLPEGAAWEGTPVDRICIGGRSRTESLRNAMAAIKPDVEIVATHDCVRPLATSDQVLAVIEAVRSGADAALPAWKTPDVLKRVAPDGSLQHMGREGYVIVQSPSAYRRSTLDRMFAALDDIAIDESVGIEQIGGRVVAVPGDRWSQHLVDARDHALFERIIEPFT